MSYQTTDLSGTQISAALPRDLHEALMEHLLQSPHQEDLTFAYWRPSRGRTRMTAIVWSLALPGSDERQLHGNAAFSGAYLRRVLRERPVGAGIAFMHSHLGPGWQDMSHDDIVAERDRISGPAAGQTGLPLLGLTLGIDGAWSARIWTRSSPNQYERIWAGDVRVVGSAIDRTFKRSHDTQEAREVLQPATQSVWGPEVQKSITSTRMGIVGLGSVGSIVCESLARMGVENITLIDHDQIEPRNLDRTAGARLSDATARLSKVEVAARNFTESSTARSVHITRVADSLLSRKGLEAALDCDVLLSCVDRPLPRHVLNTIAYSHLIPVIDGGIIAKVDPNGRPLHVDWRIHTVGPSQRCLVCLGAVSRSDIALDRDGLLDDTDYIANLPEHDRAQASGRNVFAFSLSVAAHMSLQLAKVCGAGERIGGIGPQRYHAYPGRMEVQTSSQCDADCEYLGLLGAAAPPEDLVPSDLLVPNGRVIEESGGKIRTLLARVAQVFSRRAKQTN